MYVSKPVLQGFPFIWKTDKTMFQNQIGSLKPPLKMCSSWNRHFPDMQFIALENCEHNQNAFIFDPAFITKIIKEAELFFLLDISHANWSAETRGETLLKYINKITNQAATECMLMVGSRPIERYRQPVYGIHEDIYDLVKGLVSDTIQVPAP